MELEFFIDALLDDMRDQVQDMRSKPEYLFELAKLRHIESFIKGMEYMVGFVENWSPKEASH